MALWEERSGRWDAHSHQDLEQCCLKVGNSWGPGEKPGYPGCTPNLSESGFSGAEPGTQYFNKSLVSLTTEQAWGLEIQFLVSAVKKLPRWLRARLPEPCPGLGHLGKFAGQRAGGRLCPPDFLSVWEAFEMCLSSFRLVFHPSTSPKFAQHPYSFVQAPVCP